MRPSTTVARAALTAALVLGALPGLLGSREAGASGQVGPSAFHEVILAATRDRPVFRLASPDPALGAEAVIPEDVIFQEDRQAEIVAADRVDTTVPAPKSGYAWQPAKQILTGTASFYTAGYTAMRLPRGTVIVICGAAGCLERTVTDYGPVASSGRLIDMYKPDFFAICGCGWWSGLTTVTVRVY